VEIRFTVNERSVALDVPEDRRVLDVLREELGLKGTKEGCGEGECGACTILVDGLPANACLMLAPQADGKNLRTIEGLARGDELHPVQQAFAETGAVQCGFCSPGFIMSVVALLERDPTPSDEEIIDAVSGNVCRCTGYVKILDAVHRAIELLAKEPPSASIVRS
jgi:carbon-monoxide dehydrogenase small subunit